MIRKMKCFVCFAALFCMIGTSIPVGAVKPSTNRHWLSNSPKENIFSIDGTSQEFVLLETTDSDTSTFFVLPKIFMAICRLIQAGALFLIRLIRKMLDFG